MYREDVALTAVSIVRVSSGCICIPTADAPLRQAMVFWDEDVAVDVGVPCEGRGICRACPAGWHEIFDF